MERLELDILAPVLEQVHHDFEVLLVGNVPSHDFKVCPIEQDLAEEFERLPLCDIVGRLDQERVLREELRGGRGVVVMSARAHVSAPFPLECVRGRGLTRS